MSNDNKLPTYEAGDVDQPYAGDRGNDYWVAAIDRTSPTTHGAIVECYGATEEEATALRDLLLAALPAEKPEQCQAVKDASRAAAGHVQHYRRMMQEAKAEKPAAAAERGAQGLTDERLLELRADAKADPRTADTHWFILFARAVLAEAITPEQRDYWANLGQAKADADQRRGVQMPISYYIGSVLGAMQTHVPLATPPAQAAEPAQVDAYADVIVQAIGLVAVIEGLSEQQAYPDDWWRAKTQERMTKLRASLDALAQRPAAPAEVEPLGWLYENKGGVRKFYKNGDCSASLLEADRRAANEYPDAHSLIAVYPRPAAPLATDAGGDPWESALDPADAPGSEKIWSVKIGGRCGGIPRGADAPMRAAVGRAYIELTGYAPEFTFSGWGAALTDGERAVHENRPPAAHPAAVEVPAQRGAHGEALDGWRLVPVKPTFEMRDAGAESLKETLHVGTCGEFGGVSLDDSDSCYAAMLSAAPRAPEGGRTDTQEGSK